MVQCVSRVSGLVLAAVFLCQSTGNAADQNRYSAMKADGSRLSGERIHNWHDKNSEAVFEGQKIFADNNPVRWVIDHELSPAKSPKAFVEFFGGDRLPCDVNSYHADGDSPYVKLPRHLLVAPRVSVHSPKLAKNTKIRITTSWLKRVVWEKRPVDSYDPGHAFLRDGRKIPFRSLRWSSQSVSLLLETGIQEIFFDDLREIHFPLPDVWDVYCQQMAVLSPQSAIANGKPARLMQLETDQGLIATTSTERLAPEHHGDKNKPKDWYHRCQPAWSLDPLWVRFEHVWCRRFFDPDKVPLSLVAPSLIEQDSPLGSSWHWRTNRNVYGQAVQSADEHYAWGFGVHAFHRMEFPLPVFAESFQTEAALDQSVGNGGCVRWRVMTIGKNPKVAFESQVVSGTKQRVSTGRLALSPDIVGIALEVDPLVNDTPPGKDPLDIRDSLNWLEPVIHLNAEKFRPAVAKHILDAIPALAGWNIETDVASSVLLTNDWDDYDSDDPRYSVLIAARKPFFSVSKSLYIGPTDRWLAVAVSRPHTKSPAVSLQVHINGQAIAELEIPASEDARGPDPLLFPVEAFQGNDVEVRLVQFPTKTSDLTDDLTKQREFAVTWRGITLTEHRPDLIPLVADRSGLLQAFNVGDGTATWDSDETFSGISSVKVTPTMSGAMQVPGWQIPIRSQPRLGEYRYISFAWKKTTGLDIALGVGHQGKLGGDDFENPRPRIQRDPALMQRNARLRRKLQADGRGLQYGYRYSTGRGKPELGAALKLDKTIPEKWRRVERDLFNDFGGFTLTGLSFHCPDGEAAWFDEIYLARDHRDFEHLPSRQQNQNRPDDPNLLAMEHDPARFFEATRSITGPFAVTGIRDGLRRLKTERGKNNVLWTIPKDQKTSCRLRAPVMLPKKGPIRLELEVHRHQEGDWNLEVLANGEKVHDAKIDKNTAKSDWVRVSVNLDRFAGQTVLLEVLNTPNNWHNEDAYWSRITLETPTAK